MEIRILETEQSRGEFRYTLVDGEGHLLTTPEYYNVVNDTWTVRDRSWSFRSKLAIEDYREAVFELLDTKPIIFRKKRWLFDKVYKFLPVLTSDGHKFKVIYYLKGSGKSYGRHNYNYLTFKSDIEVKQYYANKLFEPIKKIVG